jgi:IrrE N-terminal-like domain
MCCSTVAATPEPERKARDVLAEFESSYGYDGALPVPVEEIADSLARLRVDVRENLAGVPGAPQDAGGLSGMLLCRPVMTIYVNAREARSSPGRARFTVAHELGHWYLHAAKAEGENFQRFCREPDLRARGQQEGEANRFAANLLMPEELLGEHAVTAHFNVALLAKRFDVSLPAMQLRLRTLDLLPSWMH